MGAIIMENITSPQSSIKRDIARAYNKIHQEFYGTGVADQHINILFDRLIIFSTYKRVPAFTALSKNFKELTTYADAALIAEFKSKLKKEIEEVMDLPVLSILKDYDYMTEHACCVVIFKNKIE